MISTTSHLLTQGSTYVMLTGEPSRHGGPPGPPQRLSPVPPLSPQMVNPSVVPLKPTWVNSRNVPNRSTRGF